MNASDIIYAVLSLIALVVALAWIFLPLLLLNKLDKLIDLVRASNRMVDNIQQNQYIGMQTSAPPPVEPPWAKRVRENNEAAQYVEAADTSPQYVENQPPLS